jgi:hypothetical protein
VIILYTRGDYFNDVKAGKYGVYGDVAYFRPWIDYTVSHNGGAKYCHGKQELS